MILLPSSVFKLILPVPEIARAKHVHSQLLKSCSCFLAVSIACLPSDVMLHKKPRFSEQWWKASATKPNIILVTEILAKLHPTPSLKSTYPLKIDLPEKRKTSSNHARVNLSDLYNLFSTPQGLKIWKLHRSINLKPLLKTLGTLPPGAYLFILSHKIHGTGLFLYLENLYTIQKQSLMDP